MIKTITLLMPYCFLCLVTASPTLTTKFIQAYPSEVSTQETFIDDPILDGWSTEVYDELYETAVWSKLAYCSSKTKPKFSLGTLKDSCPMMEFCRSSEDTEIVQIFKPKFSKREYSGHYFIAAKHSEKKIILSFRGTDSFGDWATNAAYQSFQYRPVLSQSILKASSSNSTIFDVAAKGLFKGAQVHRGIFESYTKFARKAEDTIKPYVNDGYKFYITGHSLGGGYAYLAGIDFLLAGYKPVVITFSSLRIGNIQWNQMVDDLFKTKEAAKIVSAGGGLPVPSLTRVIQTKDPVPQLPPFLKKEGATSYSHSGLLFELEKVPLPHLKSDVSFRGATNRQRVIDTSPFDLKSDWKDRVIIQGAKWYSHSFLFDVIASPCDDSYYDGVDHSNQELLENIVEEIGSFLSKMYNGS